jgi:hypothetical protein
MTTLKNIYLSNISGINGKLAEAFDLGKKFILPVYQDQILEDGVDIDTVSPMFTVLNSGSASLIQPGYTVKYIDSGTVFEKEVSNSISPIVSSFDVTDAPSSSLTAKVVSFSSPRPETYNTLLNGIQSAASAGKSVFTVNVETIDNTTYLRLNGNYLNAYFAGIYYALNKEGIFNTYEVSLSLNTASESSTSIDFNFTFTYS